MSTPPPSYESHDFSNQAPRTPVSESSESSDESLVSDNSEDNRPALHHVMRLELLHSPQATVSEASEGSLAGLNADDEMSFFDGTSSETSLRSSPSEDTENFRHRFDWEDACANRGHAGVAVGECCPCFCECSGCIDYDSDGNSIINDDHKADNNPETTLSGMEDIVLDEPEGLPSSDTRHWINGELSRFKSKGKDRNDVDFGSPMSLDFASQ
ncbi:hypothetical protein FRC09_001205 [Ceratobasidium sp. 395]|nr:hypothetical protein FRC09_001205 [Ceratobasidium sp. 395]